MASPQSRLQWHTPDLHSGQSEGSFSEAQDVTMSDDDGVWPPFINQDASMDIEDGVAGDGTRIREICYGAVGSFPI